MCSFVKRSSVGACSRASCFSALNPHQVHGRFLHLFHHSLGSAYMHASVSHAYDSGDPSHKFICYNITLMSFFFIISTCQRINADGHTLAFTPSICGTYAQRPIKSLLHLLRRKNRLLATASDAGLQCSYPHRDAVAVFARDHFISPRPPSSVVPIGIKITINFRN